MCKKNEMRNLDYIMSIFNTMKNLESFKIVQYFIKYTFLSRMVDFILGKELKITDIFKMRLFFYFFNREFVEKKHQRPTNSIYFGTKMKKEEL
jgi:hypothetical protein